MTLWAKIRLAGQIGLGLLLLVLLWRGLDGAEVARLLAGADWRWLGWALAALTLQTFASAIRWRLTARALGQDFGYIKAVSEYYLAQFFNQTLPGGLLGDAGRAIRARHHAGLVRASQAVAFERLAGQGALFAIMAFAFLMAILVPFGASWPLWLTAAGLAPAVGLGALAGLIALGARLPGAAGRGLADLKAAFRASVLDRRAFPLQVALSFATAGLNVAAFALAARATGTTLTLAETMALGPAILAFMLVPLTVSGWGLREGAAAALFPLAGASAEAGLAASVAFGLTFIVAALPGAIPFMRMGRATMDPNDLGDDLDDLDDDPSHPANAAIMGRVTALRRTLAARFGTERDGDAPGRPAE
jgi:uncharacterized membrane protein YbhN (UPF0104 family)